MPLESEKSWVCRLQDPESILCRVQLVVHFVPIKLGENEEISHKIWAVSPRFRSNWGEPESGASCGACPPRSHWTANLPQPSRHWTYNPCEEMQEWIHRQKRKHSRTKHEELGSGEHSVFWTTYNTRDSSEEIIEQLWVSWSICRLA